MLRMPCVCAPLHKATAALGALPPSCSRPPALPPHPRQVSTARLAAALEARLAAAAADNEALRLEVQVGGACVFFVDSFVLTLLERTSPTCITSVLPVDEAGVCWMHHACNGLGTWGGRWRRSGTSGVAPPEVNEGFQLRRGAPSSLSAAGRREAGGGGAAVGGAPGAGAVGGGGGRPRAVAAGGAGAWEGCGIFFGGGGKGGRFGTVPVQPGSVGAPAPSPTGPALKSDELAPPGLLLTRLPHPRAVPPLLRRRWRMWRRGWRPCTRR
jgi:hypothetical protein